MHGTSTSADHANTNTVETRQIPVQLSWQSQGMRASHVLFEQEVNDTNDVITSSRDEAVMLDKDSCYYTTTIGWIQYVLLVVLSVLELRDSRRYASSTARYIYSI